MNEKNFTQPLVFFFNGVNSIVSCNGYVSWSGERNHFGRYNMINDDYLSCFFDSIYASTSERFHKSRPAGRYDLGKSGRFLRATSVCFVILNRSRISGPVKYLSSFMCTTCNCYLFYTNKLLLYSFQLFFIPRLKKVKKGIDNYILFC